MSFDIEVGFYFFEIVVHCVVFNFSDLEIGGSFSFDVWLRFHSFFLIYLNSLFILKKCAKCNVLTFGTKKADIYARKVKKQKEGQTEFVLNIFKDKTEITAKSSKEVSLSDCLAATAAAYAAGLGIDEIKKGLEGIN